MSLRIGKPTICIGENKGADQLRSNHCVGTLYILLCHLRSVKLLSVVLFRHLRSKIPVLL